MRASRGNYTILFVGALVMLMGGGALAVDLGRYRLAWQEASAGAEAAAMGGALTLRVGGTLAARRALAVTRATDLLEANLQQVVVDVQSDGPTVDIGIWNAETGTFEISSDAGAAVRIVVDHQGIAARFARTLGGDPDGTLGLRHAVVAELTPRDVVLVSDLSLGTPLHAIEAMRSQLGAWITRTAELGVPQDTVAVVGVAGVASGSDALRSLPSETNLAADDVDFLQPCVVPVDAWLNYYRFQDYSAGGGELGGSTGVEIRPVNPSSAMANPKLKWSNASTSPDPGADRLMTLTSSLRFSGAAWPTSLASASLVDEEVCAAYLTSWQLFEDLDPRGQRTVAWPDSWLQCDDGNLLKDSLAGRQSSLEMPGLDCSTAGTSGYVVGEDVPAGGFGTIGGDPSTSYTSDAAWAAAGSFLDEGIWQAHDMLAVDGSFSREGVAIVFTGGIPGCGVEMAGHLSGSDTCDEDEVQARVSEAVLSLAGEAATVQVWVLDEEQAVVDWWSDLLTGLQVEVRTVDATDPDAGLRAAFDALDGTRPVRRVL